MRSLSVSLFLFLADFASAANVSEIPSFARPKFSISTIEKDGLLFPHRKTYQRLTVGQDTRQSLRCPKNEGLARRRESKKCEQLLLLLLLQVDYYLRTQIPHHASPELFFAVRRLVSLGWKICRTSQFPVRNLKPYQHTGRRQLHWCTHLCRVRWCEDGCADDSQRDASFTLLHQVIKNGEISPLPGTKGCKINEAHAQGEGVWEKKHVTFYGHLEQLSYW
jgi:hypothetical protein